MNFAIANLIVALIEAKLEKEFRTETKGLVTLITKETFSVPGLFEINLEPISKPAMVTNKEAVERAIPIIRETFPGFCETWNGLNTGTLFFKVDLSM